ncbi:hypothetical protein [Nafulsella turpanensis]|uniref:hypothetical protein n=1 Tax=Nafulsella turpanensis TaxID=1265690 RepID=UPI00034A84C3|nr:hypothetical protein [Nafulsella turpanensis]
MKTKNFVLVSALAFGMFACGEDEVAPESAQVSLAFNTVKTSTGISNANERVLASGLSFSSGFITIREVQFEAESDTDSVEVNFEQVTKIDFATGASTPDISGLVIPTGTYREVEVEVELQDGGDEPAVVLNGTFTYDGVSHPVRFEFNSGETFEVEKEGVITFAGGESIVAQVTFDPNAWFLEVESEQLSVATKNAEGVVVISETQNTNIFEIVADGLDLATEVEISK